MKKSVQCTLFAAALAVLFASGGAYASTTTYQTNGVSALTLACLNNCSSTIYLSLNSSKSGGTTSWVVLFGVFGTDSSGNSTSITGSGTIPSSMVSGNGNNNLTLNLDTNAAGLQVQSCVNGTCAPFSGGVITVNWQTNNLFSNHIVSQNQYTFGPMTVHVNQQSDLLSATAQSNAFGTQFSDSAAQLGTAHQGTVSITKP